MTHRTIDVGALLRAKRASQADIAQHRVYLQRWALTLLARELEQEIEEGSTFAKHDLAQVVSMLDEISSTKK